MNKKKYCLHPGKMLVMVMQKDEDGNPTNKLVKANKYFSACSIARLYGVDMKLCVTWNRRLHNYGDYIHLFPDKEGRYVIEERENVDSKSKAVYKKISKL